MEWPTIPTISIHTFNEIKYLAFSSPLIHDIGVAKIELSRASAVSPISRSLIRQTHDLGKDWGRPPPPVHPAHVTDYKLKRRNRVRAEREPNKKCPSCLRRHHLESFSTGLLHQSIRSIITRFVMLYCPCDIGMPAILISWA